MRSWIARLWLYEIGQDVWMLRFVGDCLKSCRLFCLVDSCVSCSFLDLIQFVLSSRQLIISPNWSIVKWLLWFGGLIGELFVLLTGEYWWGTSMLECVSVSNCCTCCMTLCCSLSCSSILSSHLYIFSMDVVMACSVLLKSLSELMELVAWLVGFDVREYLLPWKRNIVLLLITESGKQLRLELSDSVTLIHRLM